MKTTVPVMTLLTLLTVVLGVLPALAQTESNEVEPKTFKTLVSPGNITFHPWYADRFRPLLNVEPQWETYSSRRALNDLWRRAPSRGEGDESRSAAEPPIKQRGGPDWTRVFRSAAPSVVFLVGPSGGFGTGFLVHEDGWVITNHHVARIATLDGDRNWKMNAYQGSIADHGGMTVDEKPRVATVYKWDAARDLALLKVEEDQEEYPALALETETTPASGLDVALIGHANNGLLWAIKPGHIASVGTIERSLPELVSRFNSVRSMSASATDPSMAQRIGEQLAESFKGWIGGKTLLIQSTAGTSPGDSGGPLLNVEGRLVGVAMGLRTGINVPTTASYYIHVNEVRNFMSAKPSFPLLELQSDFRSTSSVSLGILDMNADGRVDSMRGTDADGNVNLFACDFDQDTDVMSYVSEMPIQMPILAIHSVSASEILTTYRRGILVRNGRDGEAIWTRRLSDTISSSAVSTNGTLGLYGLGASSLVGVSLAEGTPLWQVDLGSQALSIAFLGDRDEAWVGTASGTTFVISGSGDVLGSIQLTQPVRAITSSPSGKHVAIGEFMGPVKMFETEGRALVWENTEVSAYQIRFVPDGSSIMTSPYDESTSLTLLSAETGRVDGQLELGGSPYAFEVSPDGTAVAALLFDQGMYVVHNIDDGQRLRSLSTAMIGGDVLAAMAARGAALPVEKFGFDSKRITSATGLGRVFVSEGEGADDTTSFMNSIEAPDMEKLVTKGFDAEFAWVVDSLSNSCYIMYDVDGDSRFDVIHVDDALDGSLDFVYVRNGEEFDRQTEAVDTGVFLDAAAVPAEWRQFYQQFLESNL